MARTFFKRIRFKYKILIINEHTFEEKFNFRLSALSLFLNISFFTLIAFALISLLIFLTPIKLYLPGYADVSVKSDLINETVRIDSLINQINLQQKQYEMIKHIIINDLPIDTIATADSATLSYWSNLPIKRTEREKAFVENYEKTAKYELNSSSNAAYNNSNNQNNIFITPCNNALIDSIKDEIIYFKTASNSTIQSVEEGTIIHIETSLERKSKVIIQHPNSFVSIYSNIDKLLKNTGYNLKTGETFGIVEKHDSITPLSFELLLDGKKLNAQKYVIF